MTIHWHVATGLAGYGPDGADGYASATDARGIALALTEELGSAAESNYQTAESLADPGKDYEGAWRTMKLGEALTTLSANLDYDKRAQAPLYVNDSAALDATIMGIVASEFPLDITHNTRLYVWQCDDSDCDHTGEEN